MTAPIDIPVDLDRKPVLGWERGKALVDVVSLMTGILHGDTLPRVPLITAQDGKYAIASIFELPYTEHLGGHRRTLAYHALGLSLPAILVPGTALADTPRWDFTEVNLENRPSPHSGWIKPVGTFYRSPDRPLLKFLEDCMPENGLLSVTVAKHVLARRFGTHQGDSLDEIADKYRREGCLRP